MLRQRPIIDGLIGVLCCMETCPSFKLVYGKGRPRLVNARRPQRVLYFYFMDPELGQIYVRLTTWFPFTVQVAAVGRMLKRLHVRRTDPESAANPAMTRQHNGTSGAPRCSTAILSWNSSRFR